MIFSCIACTRRDNLTYLPQTISSFKDLFPTETLHIYHEPNPPIIDQEKVILKVGKTKLGVVNNWLRALESSLDYNDDYYMIMEDDIQFLSEEILNFPQTSHPVSPYCSEKNRLVTRRDVWHWPMFAKSWCGACCFIIPRKLATDIIKSKTKFLELSLSLTTKKHAHLDTAIGNFVNHKVLTHTLSLIDHVGLISENELNNKKTIVPSQRTAALK